MVQQLVAAVLWISTGVGLAHAQTKVACVGDSITALPSSWCGTLSTKLGSGYTVMNFGVSGTNLAKNVAQPYWDSAQYAPSHSFAPNIVIIMLGTNDAFDNSWPSAKSHFVADYKELLDTYTSLASKPKPYMIIPTPIGTSPFGHNGKLLESDVIPLIKQVAMEKMVPTIDGFSLFGGAMFDASLYGGSDQVHPNAQGQQKLGEAVYKVLMETGALGGASTGGAAGSGSSANAGSGGKVAAGTAGAPAAAGTGANPPAASGGSAGTGAAMSSSGAAGSGKPATSTTTVAPPSTPATTAPRASVAGSSANAMAGNSGSVTSAVSTAGTSAATGAEPAASPDSASSGCGCRTTGGSASNGGVAAGLLLLLGVVHRGTKRSQRRARRGVPTGTGTPTKEYGHTPRLSARWHADAGSPRPDR